MNPNELSEYFRFDLPANHRFLSVVGASLEAILERVNGIEDHEKFAYEMQLGVHETCSNIVEHAYKNESGRINVEIKLNEKNRQIDVVLQDKGRSFDLEAVIPPDLSTVHTNGYGLFLVRELIDEVSYFPVEGDNRWHLVKRY